MAKFTKTLKLIGPSWQKPQSRCQAGGPGCEYFAKPDKRYCGTCSSKHKSEQERLDGIKKEMVSKG